MAAYNTSINYNWFRVQYVPLKMSDLIKFGPEMAQIKQIVKGVNKQPLKFVFKLVKNWEFLTGNWFGYDWNYSAHKTLHATGRFIFPRLFGTVSFGRPLA